MIFVLILSCSRQDDEAAVNGNLVANNKKATGSSSYDLLSDDTFKSMVIEVVYVDGYEPSTSGDK